MLENGPIKENDVDVMMEFLRWLQTVQSVVWIHSVSLADTRIHHARMPISTPPYSADDAARRALRRLRVAAALRAAARRIRVLAAFLPAARRLRVTAAFLPAFLSRRVLAAF